MMVPDGMSDDDVLKSIYPPSNMPKFSIEEARDHLWQIDGAITDDGPRSASDVLEAYVFWGLGPGFGTLGCPTVLVKGSDMANQHIDQAMNACSQKYQSANLRHIP